MCNHFPFWPSLLTTALIAGAFAFWDWGIVHYTSGHFEGTARQQHECRVAAAMAKASLPAFEAVNARRAARGWPPHLIGFDPLLFGVTDEGRLKIFPDAMPDTLRTLLLLAPPLDCTSEFQVQAVPVMRYNVYGADGEPLSIRALLSRIVFSPDGREAYVERSWTCGGECGEGFDTVWRLKDSKWVLVRSRPAWVS
jgi:hypothetical protein